MPSVRPLAPRARRAVTSLGVTAAVVLAGAAFSFFSAQPSASSQPLAFPLPGEKPAASSGVYTPLAPSDSLHYAGEPPEADERSPGRESTHVARYTLEAELVPETHVVRGKGTVTWTNRSRATTDRLFVHLYLNAFKSPKTVFWRTPIHDFRGDAEGASGRIEVTRFHVRELDRDVWPEGATTPGDPDDQTDIEVPLPTPIPPGESLTIDMEWTSHLPAVALRTGYSGSFHMVAQWFPKLARLERDGTWAHFPFHRLSEFYSDFGAYDVRVTAPKGFVVGATGSLRSEEPAPDGTERTVRRYEITDVHDFAFTAWDEFQTLEDRTKDGVAIRCLYPPGAEAAARIEVDAAKFGLGYLGDAFGKYPYETLTIVHPPRGAAEAGGMEYPTLITTGGRAPRGPVTVRDLEIVTLHELAHQWFYGLVATNEHRYPFLDEGLTSYAEMDACEALFPDASAGEGLGLTLGLPALYRAWTLESTGNARASDPTTAFVSGGDYGAMVYSRTSTTLRTLANVYGQDTVRRAIGLYARRYRFRHPTPDDLFETLRQSLGEEAATAARAALTEPVGLDYVADAVWSERHAEIHRGYALVRRHGPIVLPVDVVLLSADGSTKRVRWTPTRESERLPYEGSSALIGVLIDPEHKVLLDQDLTNNALRKSGTRFAWHTFEATSFAASAAARLLLP